MKGELIFILGGARSGKSSFAQGLGSSLGDRVLYVAPLLPLDDEMRRRIEQHRRARPSQWRTLEVSSGVAQAMRDHIGSADVVILDCLSLLIAGLMSPSHDPAELERADYDALDREMGAELERLLTLVEELPLHLIIVSNEVGSGLVPTYRSGRVYRDLLGKANQLIAQRADRVYFMIAGLPMEIKPSRSKRRGGGDAR